MLDTEQQKKLGDLISGAIDDTEEALEEAETVVEAGSWTSNVYNLLDEAHQSLVAAKAAWALACR